MRGLIVAGLMVGFASSAFAQVTGPAQPTFEITLTEAQLNTIGRGLGKLLLEDAVETRDAVLKQVNEQIKAREVAAAKQRAAEIDYAVNEKLKQEKPQ